MCRSKAEGGRRCDGAKRRVSLSAAASRNGSVSSGKSTNLLRRSRAAILRDAQKQLGNLLEAVVDAAPVNSAVTLVSATDADVAGQAADALTAALNAEGCVRGEWREHLLCGALVTAAHAMEAGEAMAKQAVTGGVTAALTSSGIPRLAAGLAARAATDKLMKLTPVGHWEAVRRAMELLAVSACPDVADHPEVERYCLRPLVSELLFDDIQQELEALTGVSPPAFG